MNKDNGGSAFPSHGTMGEVVCEGMTLRDYFAAKAMQEILQYTLDQGGAGDPKAAQPIARAAYLMADAMLAEQAK